MKNRDGHRTAINEGGSTGTVKKGEEPDINLSEDQPFGGKKVVDHRSDRKRRLKGASG